MKEEFITSIYESISLQELSVSISTARGTGMFTKFSFAHCSLSEAKLAAQIWLANAEELLREKSVTTFTARRSQNILFCKSSASHEAVAMAEFDAASSSVKINIQGQPDDFIFSNMKLAEELLESFALFYGNEKPIVMRKLSEI